MKTSYHTYHTYREIMSQPEAWQNAIDATSALRSEINALKAEGAYHHIIFTGCGSTYYLAQAAAALFTSMSGDHAQAIPAGEILLYPNTAYPNTRSDQKILLVAISRSGASSETVKITEQFTDHKRGKSLVITTEPESALAAVGDIVINIPKGSEKSVAQTRSFASMYVAVTAFCMIWGNKKQEIEQLNFLSGHGAKLIEEIAGLAEQLGRNLDLDRFYFLGSGPRYGLACEANLKMKEMTLTHSEPFHFMEFRHGPMSMVGESAAVIGLLSSEQRPHEQKVLTEMEQLGGQIIQVAENDGDFSFNSKLPEAIRNVLYLPPLQLIAFYRSVAKGLNPDRPTNLTAVVELDLG